MSCALGNNRTYDTSQCLRSPRLHTALMRVMGSIALLGSPVDASLASTDPAVSIDGTSGTLVDQPQIAETCALAGLSITLPSRSPRYAYEPRHGRRMARADLACRRRGIGYLSPQIPIHRPDAGAPIAGALLNGHEIVSGGRANGRGAETTARFSCCRSEAMTR